MQENENSSKMKDYLIIGLISIGPSMDSVTEHLGYQKEYQSVCNQGWNVVNIPGVVPSDESDYFKNNPKLTCIHLTALVGLTTGIAMFGGGTGLWWIMRFLINYKIMIVKRDDY